MPSRPPMQPTVHVYKLHYPNTPSRGNAMCSLPGSWDECGWCVGGCDDVIVFLHLHTFFTRINQQHHHQHHLAPNTKHNTIMHHLHLHNVLHPSCCSSVHTIPTTTTQCPPLCQQRPPPRQHHRLCAFCRRIRPLLPHAWLQHHLYMWDG